MPRANLDGTEINYIDTGGDGTPVLLLHAFPLNSGMWAPQVESLGERYRLIAPDLKGFGSSSAPEDRSAFSMEAFAKEVKQLLDHLDVDQVILGGLSMGGYIAFAFLKSYPGSVKALILADTRADADAPEAITKRSGQQDTVASEGTAPLIEALPGALLGETTRTDHPDVVARASALMDNPAAGFIGALEAMKTRPDSTEMLSSIDKPTLIIVGEEDGVTPPELSRTMHEHISGSRLVVIPEAGHLSSIEAPDAFNGAVAEFLAEL
jgi:pimeloyl-ACP methyl ester carboxylesterase